MPRTRRDFHVRNPPYAPVLPVLIPSGTNRGHPHFFQRALRAHGPDRLPNPQDLNCFGGFGQQGYGYIVSELRKEIGNILGLQNTHKAVVLGSGHLGQAVSAYLKFETKGFQLIGMFDNNPAIIGTSTLCDLIVTDVAQLEEFCQQHKPTMAVLCIPLQAAAELVERLYGLGIRTFWNFSHFDILRQYPDVTVESVHLSDSLMTLCYLMNENPGSAAKPLRF